MITKSTAVGKERKERMIEKTRELFSTHKNYMLVNIHKVQSNQFKDIMAALPSNVKALFAKNKIMIKVLKELGEEKYSELIKNIHDNVLVMFFDNVDPKKILDISESNQRKAFAVAGDLAKKDVVVPAGPTGLAPEKINLFQSAKMTTKINKGKIDVALDHVLVKKGDTVGIAEANLLNMLNIMPFEFGLEILKIFENGEVYTKDLLLITEECIEKQLKESISMIAALSLGAGVVTEASLPYEINNAYSEILKVSLGCGFDIENKSN